MIAWFVFFVTGIVETFVNIFFYDSFLNRKWDGSHRVLSFVSLYVANMFNALVMEALPYRFIPWKLVTLIAVHVIYVKTFYLSAWSISFFFAMLQNTFLALLGSIAFSLMELHYLGSHTESAILEFGLCIVWTGVLLILRKKLPHIKLNIKNSAGITSKFGLFQILSLIAGIYYYFLFVNESVADLFGILVAVSLVGINILSLFLMQEYLIKDKELRLSEIQNEKNQNQLQAFRDMNSLYERQGRKLHDYKKQVGTVHELLKNGDVESAIKFTEQLTKSIDVEMSEVNVGHPVINAVLNQQYCVAKGEGIGMTFTISDLHDVRLSDDDIVVLLGNLIENAIHECKRVMELGKSVNIGIKFIEKDGNLILTVRNPVCERVEIEDNKVIKPVMDGHGIGLKNVEAAVAKNNGSFAISCDDKEFVAVVMI